MLPQQPLRIVPGQRHTILVNSKDRTMFSDWLSTSLTVAICVAGALMVGRYPTLSGTTVRSSRVRMLKPVQLLID